MKKISIVIPVLNEERNIPVLYRELVRVLDTLSYDREIIFVDDGSTDGSERELRSLAQRDASVKGIEFSRNFGKEAATSAGLSAATGDAVIMVDADLQHPLPLLPEFIKKWEAGAEMVVGVRKGNKGEKLMKKLSSVLFYWLMNMAADIPMMPGTTDYRLIDRKAVSAFNEFTERDRITRGLLDWLGFKREYVYFVADKRASGSPSYSTGKLMRLAISTFRSHSLLPLRIAGSLGIFITLLSSALGLYVLVALFIFDDTFESSAMLAVLILFLVGIILICLGFMASYVGAIQREVLNRPMYVIRKKRNF